MKIQNFVAQALAFSLLTACNTTFPEAPANSPMDPQAQPTRENENNPATPDPRFPPRGSGPSLPQNPLIGESCVSDDPEQLCLAVHFVSYKDPNGIPVANPAQLATIIRTMNRLFAVCKIGFQIENYEAADPAQFNLSYGAQSQNETNQIRNIFGTTNDELLAVNTGPWGTSVNAWTNMPGTGIYGAIMEASIVSYGGGVIYAHEFGHYLGLDHYSNSSNLMNPVIYTSSNQLTSEQCTTAQRTVHSYWLAMIRH